MSNDVTAGWHTALEDYLQGLREAEAAYKLFFTAAGLPDAALGGALRFTAEIELPGQSQRLPVQVTGPERAALLAATPLPALKAALTKTANDRYQEYLDQWKKIELLAKDVQELIAKTA